MSSDWQRKLKRELKNETLKEFEGWSHNDLVSAIMELREQKADLASDCSQGMPPGLKTAVKPI